VERGFYVAPVARFQREFGDALHVVFFEELTAAPRATFVQLLDALDLDAAPTVEPELSPANPFALPRTQGAANVLASARARRAARAVVPLRFREPVESLLLRRGPKPALDEETRLLLEHAYAAEAQQLAELLGRPLPWCAS
jgi:hypothetical protein